MRVAYLGRTELNCSVPVLLLLPAAVIAGRTDEALVMLGSLAAHELAHAFTAHRLGCRVLALEIWPFGFIARLDRAGETESEAAAIAAAGPVTSLLIAVCAAGLAGFSARSGALRLLASFNLTLGAVNLLPVLPLDGGRLLLAFLERGRRGARAGSVLAVLGAVTGFILALAGVLLTVFHRGSLAGNGSLELTGAFLVFAAVTERRRAAGSGARRSLTAAMRVIGGRPLRVTPAAMHLSCTVSDALRAVEGSGYGLILVVDDALRTVGTVDEGRLTEAALRGETRTRLGELIK